MCYDITSSVFTLRLYDVGMPHDLLAIIVLGEIKFLVNVEWPFNIVGNENMNNLYFSDDNCKCIWKIDTINNRPIAEKWLSELGDEFSLSTASDNHLQVLRFVKDLLHLEIYDQDAKLQRSMSLPSDFKGPFRAIQKPNGKFIVSHKLKGSEGFCVSFLSPDGQIVRQFKLKETNGFKYVQYFDDYNNNKFVAIEGFSAVYFYDWSFMDWTLTDLSVIFSNNTDGSSRRIVGLRGTDGRRFTDIVEIRYWNFLQLFWDIENKILFVIENDLGNFHLFDTKTLQWSYWGRRGHSALSYDTKTNKFIAIFRKRARVDILALRKD